MLARLTTAVITFVCSFAVLAAGPVQAAWSSAGAGLAAQTATAMPSGPTPTVTMSYSLGVGYIYRLTWPASMLHAGRPVTGYRISRSVGGSLLGIGTCSGVTVTGLGAPIYVPSDVGADAYTCTDVSLVPLTAVRYTVTPVYEKWVGTASPWSMPTS
ncbi:hypothetical protein [Modestobacter marinus]|nr:hypothetical protein [Modestobacter marinus]NIH70312.1 hypothetical protein [Modestobacter marinus]